MHGANNKQELKLGLYHLQNIKNIEDMTGLEQSIDRNMADQLWKLLKSAIQKILQKQHSDLNFEELYRCGYILVLHKHGEMVYSELKNIIAEYIMSKMQPEIQANLNSNFIYIINNSWEHHQTCMAMIRDIFLYMDRVYAHQQNLDGVYTLGLKLFKHLVVYQCSIQTHLQATLLEMVMRERHSELVDRFAFRCVTKMLMILGNGSPSVYQENFEEPFLQQSVNFFRLESQQFLKENNASLYLRRVESRFSDEIDRSNQCYDESTTPKILKIMEEELIKTHVKAVVEMSNSGVVHMLETQLTEDLASMYRLLSRVSDGLKAMFDCISHYLWEQGLIIVRDEYNNSNAVVYVQNLLDLREKIDSYLVHSFANDNLFKQNITSTFEQIMNFNSKSPEYLSLFIDDKLKKTITGMTDDDKIILLDKTMDLFRLLQDKDMFEQYYKQHLAKRLIVSRNINEENEKDVIAKLKAECGLNYTRKMEGMFRDMFTSTSLTNQFYNHLAIDYSLSHVTDPEDYLLSMQVLTAGYWPTQNTPPTCNLPTTAFTAFEQFKTFYLSRYCGRQLTLLPQLGSAELIAYFQKPDCEDNNSLPITQTLPPRRFEEYTLQVHPTYQMCILMLFNDRPQWNVEEMSLETNIPQKDLLRPLQSLITGRLPQKILIKQPDSQKIEITDNFYINPSFNPKTKRVKTPLVQVKYETDTERQATIKRVNEDRKHEIEAAIVRVMKDRRIMHYKNLMQEVITLLSPRFVPSRDVVKTRIEVLIEREYITRNSEDRRVFEYVVG